MLKGRFLSAKRSVSFEATQNKHCTWKGCEFAEKFHKIGIFCRPFWLLRERKKFRVTRTGILRQLRWLRVASTIVLTTGQNQRLYIPLPCLRMELPGGTPAALPPPCHCAFSFGCTKSCDASHRGHLAMARCLWSNPMGSFHVRGAKKSRHHKDVWIFW